MESSDEAGEAQRRGPAGSAVGYAGQRGLKRFHTSGKRWSEEAEATFLDHLAASCNVKHSARAAGFSDVLVQRKRRTDPAFARRWQAALEQGYVKLQTLLVQRAIETMEGFNPDPDTPIPEMTVREVITILGRHRDTVEGGPRSRRRWSRSRSLDEVRDSILRKLEAIEAARRAGLSPEDLLNHERDA